MTEFIHGWRQAAITFSELHGRRNNSRTGVSSVSCEPYLLMIVAGKWKYSTNPRRNTHPPH